MFLLKMQIRFLLLEMTFLFALLFCDSDDISYDSERRLLYVIGGEGALEVFRQRDQTNYERVGRIKTAPGARTGLFVSALHRLLVAVPRRGSDMAKVLIYGTAGDKQ